MMDNSNEFTMNENDYAEHLLLSSLEDCHFNNSHHKQHYEEQKKAVSTGTLSTEEELLDEIDVFGDDESSFVDTHTDNNNTEVVLPFSFKKKVLPPSPLSPSSKPTASKHEATIKCDVSNVHVTKTLPGQQMQKKKQQKRESPSRKKPIKDNENENQRVKVEMPTEFDILCGQSRVCASHRGNKCFSVVLDQFAERYDAATSKQEKMTMTKEVVSILHNTGGRFLKYKNGIWEEISTVAARDKVSHALRTKVASWKRQQQQLLEGNNSSPGDHRISMLRTRSKSRHGKGARRSSASSIAMSASNIMTTSFDGNDSTSAAVVNDLMKAQREIFATLTSPHRSGSTDGCEPHPPKQIESSPCRRSTSYF